MITTRIIHLHANGAATTVLIADGAIVSMAEGLPIPQPSGPETAPAAVQPIPTWLIVPGQDVLLKYVALPPGAEAKASATLPYMLEDDIATPLEDAHFALGAALQDGRRLVAIAAHDRMKAWMAQAEAAGLTIDAIVPDSVAMPTVPHKAVVINRGGAYLVAVPGRPAFAVDAALLDPILIAMALDGTEVGIQLYGTNEDEALLRKRFPKATIVAHGPMSSKDWFVSLYKRLNTRLDINLRQGRYAPHRAWSFKFGPWRRAAALLAGFAGIALAYQAVAGFRYQADAERAFAQADRIAQDVLPRSTKLVNARTQLRAYAQTMQNSAVDDFMALSEILAISLADQPESAVDALRFESAQNAVTATLITPSFESIEKLKAKVTTHGGLLIAGEARQSAGAIISEVTVRRP